MPAEPKNDRTTLANERRALLEAFRGSREALLQACWAHRLWSGRRLLTTSGAALEVVFPGWLNRGAGPDFTEARLRIGDSEWFGDVEVHLDEADWGRHGHDDDPAYARVILHVVLDRSGKSTAMSVREQPVAVFHAAGYLPPRVDLVLGDADEMLRSYSSLPGRCGLRAALAGPESVTSVIGHAAEARAREKAERIAPALDGKDEAQVLFELVFQSLGYRPYAERFVSLAREFPLRSLQPLLDLPLPRAREAVLARWFGAAGLLNEGTASAADAELAAEQADLRAIWERLGLPQREPIRRRGPSRPWNSPERRMAGMFHHIYRMGRTGWLKTWLACLAELAALRDASGLRKESVRALERIFDTPADEPWRGRVSYQAGRMESGAQLVGADRAIIVMANAVIPFFLAYARKRGDRDLEKLLYRLFIVLPPEAPNAKTRFMEQRLMLTGTLPRSLRSEQGLLQIHQDFCTRFEAGCDQCGLPDLIDAPVKAGIPNAKL